MVKQRRLLLLLIIIAIFTTIYFFFGHNLLGSCGASLICPDGTLLFCQTFGDCGGNESCGYYRYYWGGPLRGVYCICGDAFWGSYCEPAAPAM